MTDFERIVDMRGAFDRRHSDPTKNYGIHGMDLRFVLKGPKGAVQFLVFTNIQLPHVAREQWDRRDSPYAFEMAQPSGADIGYHAYEPQYEGQSQMDSCEYLGQPCYYDGSSLRADKFMPEFIAGGSDAVWAMLEHEYAVRFEDSTS